jgi:hypothetical protein
LVKKRVTVQVPPKIQLDKSFDFSYRKVDDCR